MFMYNKSMLTIANPQHIFPKTDTTINYWIQILRHLFYIMHENVDSCCEIYILRVKITTVYAVR